LSAAVILGAVVTASLAVGYHVATERTRRREASLAQDIGQSLGRIIAAVEGQKQKLVRFAGQPCASVTAGLTVDDKIASYVRGAFFVKDNHIYCSTLSGGLDTPVSVYITPTQAATQIVMQAGTPLRPHHPAMIVYDRLSDRTGIGLVVAGDYVNDLLGRAHASGAQSATVVGTDGSALTSDGRCVASVSSERGRAGYLAPRSLFSVSVEGGPGWRKHDLIEFESLALLIGLLLGSALAFGYIAGYTPKQRLIRRVRRGLAHGEFFVVYQPIVDVASGGWVGAEALVRWQHPRWGVVMPGRFIREVESSPVIASLTQFVLKQALMELGAMALPSGFSLTVNLAAFHAGLRCFPDDLSEIIYASQTKLQIVLEIIERGLLTGIDDVKGGLTRLRSQGVKFAVDDFGTENSNIALLQRFHFDYIKIDRQFVQGVVSDDRKLVEGITFLAEQLGALVVAEGVEEPAQQSILKAIGVPLAQGYLFARPSSAQEFAQGYAASPIRLPNLRRDEQIGCS
jgi:c-di-GMP phosphodiesterase